jgi:hypothetical protein
MSILPPLRGSLHVILIDFDVAFNKDEFNLPYFKCKCCSFRISQTDRECSADVGKELKAVDTSEGIEEYKAICWELLRRVDTPPRPKNIPIYECHMKRKRPGKVVNALERSVLTLLYLHLANLKMS